MATVNPSDVEWVECRNCETPCYDFEIDQRRGQLVTALCLVCGNDDPTEFRIPEAGEED
jgi:hypothetical protein